ncbi:aminotransferase class IV [soil metagenome]
MATPTMIYNGKKVADDASSLLHNNRGFLMGDGFFESMRCRKGKILFEEDHWTRLWNSCALLELNMDTLPDKAALRNQIQDLIEINGFGDDVRVRLSVFRHSEGFYTPGENNAGYLLNIKSLPSFYGSVGDGLKGGIFTKQAKARGPYSNIKSLSSQLYVMAALYSRNNGFDESLILNTAGNFIEGTSTNLFLVYKDQLLTPPLSEGCVNGVFRKILIDLARNNNVPVVERFITASEITNATEIILSNVINGIKWIKTLEEKEYTHQMASYLGDCLVKELSQH